MNIDILEHNQQWISRKRAVLNQINSEGLPLVLFGWATAVDSAFIKKVQVPVQYLCDNDSKKWGKQLWGLSVIAPEQIPLIYKQYNVLILVPFEHQIIPQLEELAIQPNSIFRLDLYFEDDMTVNYFQKHEQKIKETYDLLADDLSKKTFEQVIRYRLERNARLLEPIVLPRNEQYFPSELHKGTPFFNQQEIFVDAGAFTGDTVAQFIATISQYERIFAFEPDPKNFKYLKSFCDKLEHVKCIQMGIGEKKGILQFMSDDSSSKIVDNGDRLVLIDTLDHMLGDIPVTYLKMDVEGLECAALMGAHKIIEKYKPKLAICTYHSNSDMVDIPLLIHKIDPTYKLYFRHYTNSIVETVCYALPDAK